MTYFSYLSVQVNTPAHVYFYPGGIPSYFYQPGCGRVPFLCSPTEDPAALPQPPLPQGSLLLSILQVLASARRIKFRLFSGTFKALSTGTQLPFGLMSLIPHSQPPQELTNQAPGPMLARPLHLLPVRFPSTSTGPSTCATSSMEPSLIPRWRELCPVLENHCARTAHMALFSSASGAIRPSMGLSLFSWLLGLALADLHLGTECVCRMAGVLLPRLHPPGHRVPRPQDARPPQGRVRALPSSGCYALHLCESANPSQGLQWAQHFLKYSGEGVGEELRGAALTRWSQAGGQWGVPGAPQKCTALPLQTLPHLPLLPRECPPPPLPTTQPVFCSCSPLVLALQAPPGPPGHQISWGLCVPIFLSRASDLLCSPGSPPPCP